jgi:stage III sporulation protein SpoIIIAA
MSPIQAEQTREDLQKLLAILPTTIRESIESIGREVELLEVVMDLGRRPTARYTDNEVELRQEEVSQDDIDQVVDGIGDLMMTIEPVLPAPCIAFPAFATGAAKSLV